MRLSNKLMLPLLLLACAPAPAKDDLPGVLGGVVKSDQWVIRRDKGEEEFTGNVSYRNPSYFIKGDWALYLKNTALFQIRGHVEGHLYRKDGEVTKAYGHYAKYSQKDAAASILPRGKDDFVTITHASPKAGNWQSQSRAAYFYEKKTLVDLTGDVNIKGAALDSESDRAVFNYTTSVFELTGSPLVWGTHEQTDFAVKGASATVSDYYNYIEISGDVTGWVFSRSKEAASYGTKIRAD